jgi:hypothetical protein
MNHKRWEKRDTKGEKKKKGLKKDIKINFFI